MGVEIAGQLMDLLVCFAFYVLLFLVLSIIPWEFRFNL